MTAAKVPQCVIEGRVCHDHCACPMVPSDGSELARRYLNHKRGAPDNYPLDYDWNAQENINAHFA